MGNCCSDQGSKQHSKTQHHNEGAKQHSRTQRTNQGSKQYSKSQHPNQGSKQHSKTQHPNQGPKQHHNPQHPDQGCNNVIYQGPPVDYGVIYQCPPADYETRIPVLRIFSPVPALVQGAVSALQLHHPSSPPAVPQLLPSGLAFRPTAGLPLLHPTVIGSGAGGGPFTSAHFLLKWLSTAAIVVLSAAAYPSICKMAGSIKYHQQEPDQPAEAIQAASEAIGSTPAQMPAELAAILAADVQMGQQQRQFNTWMKQKLPIVLQQKRAELQQLQDRLAEYNGQLAGSSIEATAAQQDVTVSAQEYLYGQIESLENQVAALQAEL